MTENLKLADCYPYTYVRVATMKAKLLNRDDYNKLLKMSFAEITKFLQDSEYKKEINELAMELSGADLLEAALNKNLISSFNKLLRISPDELDLLINAHLRRYDYYNIKSILRGKFANLSNEAIKKMLIPIVQLQRSSPPWHTCVPWVFGWKNTLACLKTLPRSKIF